jgi:hypothetical protein
MVKPIENYPSWELATEEDLRRLYSTTDKLVTAHGTFSVEPNQEVLGAKNGLPIIDAAPSYSLKVAFEKVLRLSPRLVELVGITGAVELSKEEPHYAPYAEPDLHESEHYYFGPRVTFATYDLTEPNLSGVYFTIDFDNGNARGLIIPRLLLDREELGQATVQTIEDFAATIKYEADESINRITKQQNVALEQLVIGLSKEFAIAA